MPLPHRLFAEFLGTALLLATVVGSGIMGVRLSGGNDGLALLANASATAGILYVLIVVLGPVSGAHFNPVVSMAMRLQRSISTVDMFAYMAVQVIGAIAGVVLAHAMFDLPWIQPGNHVRTGSALWLSEGVATFGLLLTILLGAQRRPAAVPALVASYIFAAYWFTASTSFANPAVTFARSFTQTFAGIRSYDIAGFVVAQFAGALVACIVARCLLPAEAAAKGASPSPVAGQ